MTLALCMRCGEVAETETLRVEDGQAYCRCPLCDAEGWQEEGGGTLDDPAILHSFTAEDLEYNRKRLAVLSAFPELMKEHT